MTQPTKALHDLGEWCLAGAVGAGCAWALGILLGRLFIGHDLSDLPTTRSELDLSGGLVGLLIGSIISAIAAALLLRPTLEALLFWVPVLGASTAFSAVMSVVLIHIFDNVLPHQASSSIGFALGGACAGLGGYVWSRRTAKAKPAEPDEEDEDSFQTPSEGKSLVAVQRKLGVIASCMPYVPNLATFATLVCSQAIALRVGSSDAAMGWLIGLSGIAVSITFWNYDQRLRVVERRDPTRFR